MQGPTTRNLFNGWQGGVKDIQGFSKYVKLVILEALTCCKGTAAPSNCNKDDKNWSGALMSTAL